MLVQYRKDNTLSLAVGTFLKCTDIALINYHSAGRITEVTLLPLHAPSALSDLHIDLLPPIKN